MSFEWDFGDGSPARINTENLQRHKYAKVGTYKVTLKATDEAGNTNVVTEKVYV